jgi:Bacillus/Clostridium GerA spore germination protein
MEGTINSIQSRPENLIEKAEQLKAQFKKSGDFLCKQHQNDLESFEMIYFESLIDIQYLIQNILPKLGIYKDSVKTKLTSFFQATDVSNKSNEELSDLLFEGNVIFLLVDSFLSIQAGNIPKRQPEESALETSIRGPKDGFVEDLNTNISLIRRRLNSSSLCLEKYTIGKRSKTKVALIYLDDVIDQRVLDEVHKRLEKVELDILTSIYELESYVRDKPYSIFPSMDYTGRPDFIVQGINQGRFALLVDGNPTVCFAPMNLLLQTKSPEDSYISYVYVSLERIIRMLGLVISAFLPGV